jgi:hypothetical protein
MNSQGSANRHVMLDIWIPRCPMCRTSRPHHYGTRKNAKGETIRYYRCRNGGCKTKFPGRVMNPDDDDLDEGIPNDAVPRE